MSINGYSGLRASSFSGPSRVGMSSVSENELFIEEDSKNLSDLLRDIKNPFVAEALTASFRRLELEKDTFNLREGFANKPFFLGLSLPQEITVLLKRLSENFCSYCSVVEEFPEEWERRVKRMDEIFHKLGSVQNKTHVWKDLDTFLKQPEIQALSIRNLDMIMSHIEKKGDTEALRKYLKVMLTEEAFERLERRIEALEEDFDLYTLLDEIQKNRPEEKIVNDLRSLWNQDEAYFQSRTLKLSHSDSDTNIQEPVVACKKTEDVWHFQLDDPCRTRLEAKSDGKVIVTQSHSYRLGHCLKTSLIPQGRPILLEHGEKELSELPEGEYLFDLESVKGRDGQVKVHLYKQSEKVTKKSPHIILTCSEHPERGDIVKVELNQDGIVSELPIDLFYRIRLTREDKKHFSLNDPVRQFTFDEAGPANTERAKLFQMKAIQGELARLQQQLSSDFALLDRFLDNYIKNQCKLINPELIPKGWQKQLEDISHRYSEYINQNRSVSDLVIQLMLEANYACLVPRRQNMQTRYIMELLRESQKYTSELQGKDITLFIGNTGAGKSTLIAYLLGAKLKLEKNLGGEGCFTVEEHSARYPVIGQGLGTSQTIFAQGFPISEGSSTLFCDPPGFNDTRGEEHVLCANLTIDQAVSQARSIRSIVLTIPVQAFQLDRGGAVVALVEKVRERFPDVMQPHIIDKVAQYVVLTKSGHVQATIAEAIAKGKRFEVLRDEIQDEIRKESAKEAPNMLRIHGLERQKGIWQAFLNLHDRNAIDIPDLGNKKKERREGLVKKYTNSENSFAKKRYISAMDTPEMKRRFGETLELSTASWRKVIFEKYLIELPRKIHQYEMNIREAKEEEKKLKEELSLATNEIQELGQKKQELEKINALRMAPTKEVLGRLTDLKNSRLDELRSNILQKNKKVESLNDSIKNFESRLNKKSEEIWGHQKTIEANEAEIVKLSNTPRKESLFKNDYRGRSEMTIGEWKSLEDRKECHELLDEDQEKYTTGKEEVVKCSTFKGSMYSVLQISKDYRIVPQDRNEREKFEKTLSGGGYLAEHQGADYTMDLGAKPGPSGTKVSYGYETHWYGGDRRPWLEVTHTIPGYDYHNATIIGLRGTNDGERQAIAAANAEINRLKHEIETHQNEIQLQEKAICRDKREIDTLNKEIQKNLVQDMIREQGIAIAEKEKSKERILERIARLCEDVNKASALKNCTETQKRYFAVLIWSEWETATVLRDLSQMVLNSSEKRGLRIQENSLLECEKFIEVFDKEGDEILNKVRKELNVA